MNYTKNQEGHRITKWLHSFPRINQQIIYLRQLNFATFVLGTVAYLMRAKKVQDQWSFSPQEPEAFSARAPRPIKPYGNKWNVRQFLADIIHS